MARVWHFDQTIGQSIQTAYNAKVQSTVFIDNKWPVGSKGNPQLTADSWMILNNHLIVAPSSPTVAKIRDVINTAYQNGPIPGITAKVVSGKLAIETTGPDIDIQAVVDQPNDEDSLVDDLGLKASKYYGTPRRRKSKQNNNNHVDVPGMPGTKITLKQAYLAPELLSNGKLSNWLRFYSGADNGENHAMLCMYNDQFPSNWYLKQNKRFQCVINADFNAKVGDMNWCVVWQIHPNGHPSTWRQTWSKTKSYAKHFQVEYKSKQYKAKFSVPANRPDTPQNDSAYWEYLYDGTEYSKSPPLALYIIKTTSGPQWQLGVRGASGTAAEKYTFDGQGSVGTKPFVPGTHEIIIDFKFDSETGNGCASCSIDGDVFANVSSATHPNLRIGVHKLVGGVLCAGTLTTGMYGLPLANTSVGNEPEIDISSATLYEEK